MTPRVSLIMPVHNAGPFVAEAMESIYRQTYRDFELIVVDDGCTDSTMDIVHSFNDSRLRTVRNPGNIGLAASLNKALALAGGQYIGRMDADDICYPRRIEKQVDFLDRHATVDVLGTGMQYFGYSRYLNLFPEDHESCKAQLIFNVCFGHPTVLLRKEVFAGAGYDSQYLQYGEDYDLWCRLAFRCRFANLQEPLLRYRTYPPSLKDDDEMRRKENSSRIRTTFLRSLWPDINDGRAQIHNTISGMQPVGSGAELKEIDLWLQEIVAANSANEALDEAVLERVIARRFYEYCYSLPHLGWSALQYYHRSCWRGAYRAPGRNVFKYGAKVLVNGTK